MARKSHTRLAEDELLDKILEDERTDSFPNCERADDEMSSLFRS